MILIMLKHISVCQLSTSSLAKCFPGFHPSCLLGHPHPLTIFILIITVLKCVVALAKWSAGLASALHVQGIFIKAIWRIPPRFLYFFNIFALLYNIHLCLSSSGIHFCVSETHFKIMSITIKENNGIMIGQWRLNCVVT